jgi:hypothetical protein
MMKYGRSRPWREMMELMTGTANMDTGPFLEYFEPLQKWLTQFNKDHDIKVFFNLESVSGVRFARWHIFIPKFPIWVYFECLEVNNVVTF